MERMQGAFEKHGCGNAIEIGTALLHGQDIGCRLAEFLFHSSGECGRLRRCMEAFAIGVKIMADRIEALVGEMIPRIFTGQLKKFINKVGPCEQ